MWVPNRVGSTQYALYAGLSWFLLWSGDGLAAVNHTILSRASGAAGVQADSTGVDSTGFACISGDGDVVGFYSEADSLDSNDDADSKADLFVRIRSTNTTRLVSAGVPDSPENGEGIERGPGLIIGAGHACSLSDDGKFIVYGSDATNLIVGDSNGKIDVFVRNLQTNAIFRVSQTAAGAGGDGDSTDPVISGDGRIVAFLSNSTNFVSALGNNLVQVYIRELDASGQPTGDPIPVSVQSGTGQGTANQPLLGTNNSIGIGNIRTPPSLSRDGHLVAFASQATNLEQVADGNQNIADVFVRDTQNGTTKKVSIRGGSGDAADGPSDMPSLSADGRYVAFRSQAANLDPNSADSNAAIDVFMHDRQANTTTRVNVTDTGGQADVSSIPQTDLRIAGISPDVAVTSDGRVLVAFMSNAPNLTGVPVINPARRDVFVRDVTNQRTIKISLPNGGGDSNGQSARPVISADGRFVAFDSRASNLVTPDTNGIAPDVFIRAVFDFTLFSDDFEGE